MEVAQLNLILAGVISAMMAYIISLLTEIKKDNKQLLIKVTQVETKVEKLEQNEKVIFNILNKSNHLA